MTSPDLFSPDFLADPHPLLARLRQARPVEQLRTPDGGTMWLVTRYGDVVQLLKDARFSVEPERANRASSVPNVELLKRSMVSVDDPDHRRLRALVSKGFTPAFVERQRPRVQAVADSLLDEIEPQGRMDFVGDYAFPLPLAVIAEMLGVPPDDRDHLRGWSEALIDVFNPEQQRTLGAFADYLGDLFERKRRHPGDDLISFLVQAEAQGDGLSEAELRSMVALLIVAGHETTTNLLAGGMLALFTHPDELSKLKAHPELMRGAVEELLRFATPVLAVAPRFALHDLDFAGQRVARGDAVVALVGSANRDPARFAGADDLDTARLVNDHVAFGHGIHHCLGAPLARMEGEIALATLLRRLPDVRLAAPPEALTWHGSLFVRGLRSLPVAF